MSGLYLNLGLMRGSGGRIRPLGGWTGDTNCINPSDTLVTVKFSADVYFSDNSATGVVITNTTTGEVATGVSHAATTVSPAQTIVYDVTWVTPPAPDDIIKFEYSGTYYKDIDGIPVSDLSKNINNCRSLPLFAGTISDISGIEGIAITPIPLDPYFSTGGTITTYTLQNNPAWMSIINNEIVGTPDSDTDTVGITATGSNSYGSDTSNAFDATIETGADCYPAINKYPSLTLYPCTGA